MIDELILLAFIDKHGVSSAWTMSQTGSRYWAYLGPEDECAASLAYYAGLGLIEESPEWRGKFTLTRKGAWRLAELRGAVE